MKGLKLLFTGSLLLGIAAFGFAQVNGGPGLPPEIAEVIQDSTTLAILDTEGNVIWTSDSGVPLNAVTIPEGATIVVLDAEGDVVLELTLTPAPDGGALVQLPNGDLLPIGKLVSAARRGTGAKEAEMHQHLHQRRHERKKEARSDERPAEGKEAHPQPHPHPHPHAGVKSSGN